MFDKTLDSFQTKSQLNTGNQTIYYFSLAKLDASHPIARLPLTLKILIENLLRREDGKIVKKSDIVAIVRSQEANAPEQEIPYMPARVLLQDFTGVPAVVDLAAMRDAMIELGGDPVKINPLVPVELVIDHSVQVDRFGTADSEDMNAKIEFSRNLERYEFLRWGQGAFSNFKVVPPDMGIVHQVNLEYLARVIFSQNADGKTWAYPDTLVGTDSHTTMVNGLGVLGWGVGGIEAEAVMLGQPISMLIPDVVGFKIDGQLPEGATATDLVLTVTQMLRAKGVVGKLVEFYGDGLDHLSLADRATIANMAPEYGATCGYFPIDEETLRYLRLTGREESHIEMVKAYAIAQGLFRQAGQEHPEFKESLSLNLKDVEPCLAGPKRPQDRVPLKAAKSAFLKELEQAKGKAIGHLDVNTLRDGSVVIAAITSCTNTSNPAVMLGAGLLAKKAIDKGLSTKEWVKTSLAPGSRVVTDYLNKAGLTTDLQALGFYLVGYGCTTCIGNSGPLPEKVSQTIEKDGLNVCAVLSGNRNFEGRIHPQVRMNYLASPLMVVAYAIAGRMDIDWYQEPIGLDQKNQPVYLKDIWPSQAEINEVLLSTMQASLFQKSYATVFDGDANWKALNVAEGMQCAWDGSSTYVKKPPFFNDIKTEPSIIKDIRGARVLAKLGDSVTTDHISPAGSIKSDSPAGKYLKSHGVDEGSFNSYGARRGNHEIMMRGTFANIRLRNQLAPNTEGGVTRYQPSDAPMSIFDAAMQYQAEQVPTIILAGKEYGSGSSRDWAAKGPKLLGVHAVIAESYERIHRSNLVGMGILPLEYLFSETAASLGLTGKERYDIMGVADDAREVTVTATAEDGSAIVFKARLRLDTPQEVEYVRHGGILPYVLRSLK